MISPVPVSLPRFGGTGGGMGDLPVGPTPKRDGGRRPMLFARLLYVTLIPDATALRRPLYMTMDVIQL